MYVAPLWTSTTRCAPHKIQPPQQQDDDSRNVESDPYHPMDHILSTASLIARAVRTRAETLGTPRHPTDETRYGL